jgi:hypothetical protein
VDRPVILAVVDPGHLLEGWVVGDVVGGALDDQVEVVGAGGEGTARLAGEIAGFVAWPGS